MFVENKEIILLYRENLEKNIKLSQDTMNIYIREVEDFKKFIFPENLLSIDQLIIMNYIAKLKEKYSEKTIKRKLVSLNRFYIFAEKKEFIRNNPVQGINIDKKDSIKEIKINHGEIINILDFCPNDVKGKRDRLVITFLMETGLKIREILDIKLSEITNNNEINILKKTGKITIHLSEDSVEKLKNFIENERNKIKEERVEYLFKNLSRQNFRARFIKYCKEAGINEKISPVEIKKSVKMSEFNKENTEKYEYLDKLKQEYMKIGIGDD